MSVLSLLSSPRGGKAVQRAEDVGKGCQLKQESTSSGHDEDGYAEMLRACKPGNSVSLATAPALGLDPPASQEEAASHVA
jgi:hypothetical protein